MKAGRAPKNGATRREMKSICQALEATHPEALRQEFCADARLEQGGKAKKKVSALYQDLANRRSNKQKVGATHSSNLYTKMINDDIFDDIGFDGTAWYVDQDGGQHKGYSAIYFGPWRADVFDFLELRKNHGKEEQRARDLLMKHVEENAEWTLFCSNEAFDLATDKGLTDLWGEYFERLYARPEQGGTAEKKVSAQQHWPNSHFLARGHACSTRTARTASPTSRIWGRSTRPTSAPGSLGIPPRTTLQCATSRRYLCPRTPMTRPMTTRSWRA